MFSHYLFHHFLPGKQARFSPFFLSLFITTFNVIVVFMRSSQLSLSRVIVVAVQKPVVKAQV